MIFNLIKNKKSEKAESENEDLIKILALLIHAAKIDENYSEKEKKLYLLTSMNMCHTKNKKQGVTNGGRQKYKREL